MLYAEYNKLSNSTREGMKKFNSRLAEAFVLKLQIETGIAQQKLHVLRMRFSNHTKNSMAKEITMLELVYFF